MRIQVLLKLTAFFLLSLGGLLLGCNPQDKESEHKQTQASEPPLPSQEEFLRVQTIIASSCMPCHNSQTLPDVIARTEKAGFKDIDGDTKARILGELDELQNYMKSGTPISFTDQQVLHQFFKATPGEFYMMLDKGLMPPPWAQELMKEIKWPNYHPLQSAERIELLTYSKPFAQKYLR